MKIKQIMLKNFASVQEISINLRDDVVFLCGSNGAGKSTIGLNGVWFILLGLGKVGKKVLHAERFRFIGDRGPTAEGQLILHDEAENIDIIINRKLTKNKTTLKITTSDKRQLPDDFIDDIFSIFSINPVGFAKLTPQEQSLALGIDTSENDKLKKITYDERHEIGYDVKRLKGAMEEFGQVKVKKVEKVDIQKLLKRKDQIEKANAKLVEKTQTKRDKAIQEAIKWNNEQDDIESKLAQVFTDCNNLINDMETIRLEIVEYENKIEILTQERLAKNEVHTRLSAIRNKMPVPEKKKPTDIPLEKPDGVENTSALNKQIELAETTNQQAVFYQQSVDAMTKYETAKTAYDNKSTALQKIEENRIEYIKSCNLPFSNITIDDAGGVLINNRPFNETYFSKGEVLRIGIKLAAAANPKLKYVFVPDSQSIDEKNRGKLFKELVDAGFQVVAEYVDTEKRKDYSSILLKESRVVESYEENELNSL